MVIYNKIRWQHFLHKPQHLGCEITNCHTVCMVSASVQEKSERSKRVSAGPLSGELPNGHQVHKGELHGTIWEQRLKQEGFSQDSVGEYKRLFLEDSRVWRSEASVSFESVKSAFLSEQGSTPRRISGSRIKIEVDRDKGKRQLNYK